MQPARPFAFRQARSYAPCKKGSSERRGRFCGASFSIPAGPLEIAKTAGEMAKPAGSGPHADSGHGLGADLTPRDDRCLGKEAEYRCRDTLADTARTVSPSRTCNHDHYSTSRTACAGNNRRSASRYVELRV